MNSHYILSTIAVSSISILMISAITVDVIADRDDHQKKGSNGQCWKQQKELDLGGTKEDCHESFTGKDHDEPDEPLP